MGFDGRHDIAECADRNRGPGCGTAHGKGAQHHGVEQAEDPGRETDADGQRQDRDAGEQQPPDERAARNLDRCHRLQIYKGAAS